MNKYIEKSGLPENQISLVVMSVIAEKLVSELKNLGIEVIPSESCNALSLSEGTHADMQLLHTEENNVVILSECSQLHKKLDGHGFNIYKANPIKQKYPDNVSLNCLITEREILCRADKLDESVRRLCPDKKIINVRQGYTKCSTAVINKNAYITADRGIHDALLKLGYDSLLIAPGHINLPGMDYGFIGGCCTKADKSTVLFTGNIKLHPDYDKIKAFLKNYGINEYCLCNDVLIDIGGIVPLLQKA